MKRLSVTFGPLPALLPFLFFLLCSCGGSGTAEAKIRAINASADSRAIDVYDGESVLYDAVPYGTATDYNSLEAVSHQLKITLNDSFTTFFDANRSLARDAEYTLILFDLVDNAVGSLIRDDNKRPPSGQAKLRFIQASPASPAVDVYITDPLAALSSATPTLTAVKFKEVSQYMQSVEGIYRVRVTPKDSKEILADSGGVPVDGKRIYTLMLLDKTGGGAPAKIIIFTDA